MNVRLKKEQKIQVSNCTDVYPIMREILMRENKRGRNKEHFWVIGLDTANTILFIELISLGSVNKTVVKPMEVYSLALQKRSVKIILIHNHPSRTLSPSEADKDVTDHLIQVGKFLNVPVVDHLIISEESFYSFVESGLLADLEQSRKYVLKYLEVEEMKKNHAQKEAKIEMARAMKKEGYSTEAIAKITGLKKSSIAQLKAEK